MKVYINGDFFEPQEARVSVFDHGFLYGDGIFETLRSYRGRIFRFDDHFDRLQASADKIALPLPWKKEDCRNLLKEALQINDCPDALLRLSLSRGEGPPGLDPALCKKPTIVVMVRPFHGYPPEDYARGVTIAVVSVRKNLTSALDAGIKSTNFLNNILAKIEAKNAAAMEGVLLNQDGFLTEGTVSNLFFVSHNILCTPSTECGILEGITRKVILELAREEKIVVHEGTFPPEALSNADEVFLTNTSYEVMPVNRVDRQSFRVGPITRRLMEAYRILTGK
ncbi:MAG: aminodeoxychorismate lyase [Deltaproteobacteria bacterium]|nr:aminodeoxychorismate lyase [Deltaproteobacteria bacterium]